MSKLQIGLIVVFVLAGLVAVLIFAGILPGYKKQGGGEAVQITLWGTFSQRDMNSLLSELNETHKESFRINYSEKKTVNYENELINALASGTGPDTWFLSQDMILKNKDKVFLVPAESYPERTFLDNFIDSAEVFFDPDSFSIGTRKIVGLPLAVDPIVLYWNRDLFSSAGIAQPPKYWDEFLTDVRFLTKKDGAGNVVQSGGAMGEFKNVKNAKEILSMLVLQTGNPIVKRGEKESRPPTGYRVKQTQST